MSVSQRSHTGTSRLYALDMPADAKVAAALEETNIVHVLSQHSGVDNGLPIVAPGTEIPRVDTIFSRPLGNVFITLAGVSEEDIASLHVLKAFVADKQSFKVAPASTPRNGAVGYATAVTGRTPSEHGVIAYSWLNAEGAIVRASASKMMFPSVAESLSQDFDSALVGSASSCGVLTSLGGIKRGRGARFFETALSEDGTMSGFGISVSVADVQNHASLRTSVTVDARVLVEMAFMTKLASAMAADATIAALLKDASPDWLAVSFAAVEDVRNAYGAGSPQHKDALALLEATLPDVVAALQALWPAGRAAVSVYAMATDAPIDATAAPMVALREAVASHLRNEAQFVRVLPQIYLSTKLTAEERHDVCAAAQRAVTGSDLSVTCPPPQLSVRTVIGVGGVVNGTNGTIYDPTQSGLAQASIWATVIAIVVFGGAITALFCCVHNPEDPAIYREAVAKDD